MPLGDSFLSLCLKVLTSKISTLLPPRCHHFSGMLGGFKETDLTAQHWATGKLTANVSCSCCSKVRPKGEAILILLEMKSGLEHIHKPSGSKKSMSSRPPAFSWGYCQHTAVTSAQITAPKAMFHFSKPLQTQPYEIFSSHCFPLSLKSLLFALLRSLEANQTSGPQLVRTRIPLSKWKF